MASFVIHIAVGLVVATLFGLRRRPRWFVAFAAAAPDLDMVTTDLLVRGGFGAGWDPDTASTWAFVLAHGGLSHTVLSALVVFGVAWLILRAARYASAFGVSWGSHVFTDMGNNSERMPFWPVSDAVLAAPFFVDWEPVLNVLAFFFIVGMGMEDLYRSDWLEQFGKRTRLVLRRFGPRLARGAFALAVIFVAFALSARFAIGVDDDLGGHHVAAAGFPAFNIVEESNDGYRVTRWEPFGGDGGQGFVPRIPAGLTDGQRAQAEEALCITGQLGILDQKRHPVVLQASADEVIVGEPAAAVGLAGPEDRGVLRFMFPDAGPRAFRASIDAVDDGRELPRVLVRAASC